MTGDSRPVPALPTSRLDVNVYPGRVEIYEHYSSEAAARLEDRLRKLGVQARLLFRSPCG